MRCIDVFNGDADGICALLQLRFAEPAESQLVTGLKRDIDLLGRVEAGAGDAVTVLDVSLDRNRAALLRLLERGAQVRYFDHHFPGAVPSHPGLRAVIETSGGICTSMLVDRQIGGQFRPWAVAGAFGDGLDQSAMDLGATIALGAAELEKLRELGRSLNYNAYGETEDDVLVRPDHLYRVLARFPDPLQFVAGHDLYERLNAARHADLDAAVECGAHWTGTGGEVHVLPDAPWSRRIGGTFANHLVRIHRHRAVAVLVKRRDGDYLVSVRVPQESDSSADAFCREFAGGGGRREAAGIDRLPAAMLEEFVRRFSAAYP